ncbi:hypothetical protein [Streptomyces sp. NPDC059278]|uniref:hypothetical protein n=1 Tax=Streptomyces sp. NPDC059278 TaxID=3346801 RepID=UPI0036B755AF
MDTTAFAANVKIDIITEGDRLTTGWSTSRQQATAVATFSVDVPHAPLSRTLVQLGDYWYPECGRCGGSGNVGYGPFNGICYLCNGHGTKKGGISDEQLAEKINSWAKRAAAESRIAERKMAAARAERDAWRTENTELVTWAESLTPDRLELMDTYVHIEDTQAEAERSEGRPGLDRLVNSKKLEDGRWWACFYVEEEVFDTFSSRVQDSIRILRLGGRLDRKETAYLKAVANSDDLQKQIQAGLDSRHAATEGRLEITGKIVMIQERNEGDYLFIKVEGVGADTGITWVTNGSGKTVWDLNEGDTVRVKATIKQNETYKGIKSDRVGRAVFTVVDETAIQEAPAVTETPAPAAPAAEPTTPAEAPAAPVAAQPKTARPTQREAQGASVVDGWDVLYDKPRAKAQVVKNTEGAYGLVCTEHKTVHPLARLTDERALRRDGGWCCH